MLHKRCADRLSASRELSAVLSCSRSISRFRGDVSTLCFTFSAIWALWPNCETNANQAGVRFLGELNQEQQKAFAALLKDDTGVLAATTTFGKTVVAVKPTVEVRKERDRSARRDGHTRNASRKRSFSNDLKR